MSEQVKDDVVPCNFMSDALYAAGFRAALEAVAQAIGARPRQWGGNEVWWVSVGEAQVTGIGTGEPGRALAEGVARKLANEVRQLNPPAGGLRRFRHRRRGGTYAVLGSGRLQAEKPVGDLMDVTVYVSESDGSLWVRPTGEFGDGRFEELP